MPTYQYSCTDCGEPLEVVQSFTDDALTECPVCGGKLRKVFNAVGIVFKGSGFYRTDSRSGSSSTSPPRARPAVVDSGSSGSDSSGSSSPKSDSATPSSSSGTTSGSGSGSSVQRLSSPAPAARARPAPPPDRRLWTAGPATSPGHLACRRAPAAVPTVLAAAPPSPPRSRRTPSSGPRSASGVAAPLASTSTGARGRPGRSRRVVPRHRPATALAADSHGDGRASRPPARHDPRRGRPRRRRATGRLPRRGLRRLEREVTGRVVAFPVRSGEVVRGRDVVGRALLDALGAEVVATPVRLSDDATLSGVRPGDLVDVLAARAADGGGAAHAEVVAAGVRVLTVGPVTGSGNGGLLGSSGGTSAPVLLLATTPAQSLAIAAAVVASRLSVTLRAG